MKHTTPIPKEQLKALITLAKAGDKNSMRRLIGLCEQMVYCNCCYLLKDQEDAKDMAQEVFLTVFTKIDTLKKAEAFFDWVKIIKINKCRNKLKQGNPYFLLEDASGSEDKTDPYSRFADRRDQNSPESSLDRKEVKDLLVRCIDDLSDAQRLCIILFYYDDLSLKQIARLMDVSVGTVKSRLAYGRLNLKKALEKEQRRGVTLFGRTPAVLLGYVAYFLKKQFKDHSEAAAMETIAERTLELAGGIGAGELGDAALAESAYAFVTTDYSLKALSVGTFWTSAAGKAVITTLVGGAVAGSVLGGVKLSGLDRERQLQAQEEQFESRQIEDSAWEESVPLNEEVSRNTSAGPETEGTENANQSDANQSASEQSSADQSSAAAAQTVTGEEDSGEEQIVAEGSGEEIYTQEAGAEETTIPVETPAETSTGSSETSANTEQSQTEESSSTSARIEQLRNEVEMRQATYNTVQADYDAAQITYDAALARAENDLTECKAMVVRELPLRKETYESMILMNQQESGTYSEEEVAQALASYNEWTEYYNTVYPATLDDVRNQIFPEYFGNLNNCGSDLVEAEETLARLTPLLETAKTDLETAQAALAAEEGN